MEESNTAMGHNAMEELKRVDHLIFVTLKYTRTVDIIKNVIERLVTAIDFEVLEVLEYLKEKGKVSSIGNVALVRCRALEALFQKDKTVKDIIDFYYFLRKISQSEYKKKEEYRKNVALVTNDVEIDIDTLKEYAEKTKKYIYYLKEQVR